MAYFDDQDWKDLKQILKKDYWEYLRMKWRTLGQNEERMLEFLKKQQEEFKKKHG